jgi:SAM-dependent methyltransferase/uncharacterized protein YbaR (Trm112 family)
MDTHLLTILRCSHCLGALTVDVYAYAPESKTELDAGLLQCTNCQMQFAVWRGVPRMNLEEDFRLPKSFVTANRHRLAKSGHGKIVDKSDWQLNPYDESWSLDRDGAFEWGRLDRNARRDNFYCYLCLERGALAGKLVLDAGCGNGAVAALVAQDGVEVVAFDYSDVVVRAESLRRHNAQAGRIHYVQADAQYPPFAAEAFDAVYSDGVIHLTGNTRHAFANLSHVVKPGGRMFVSVSREDLQAGYRIRKLPTDVLQRLFRILPVRFSKPLCLVGAAILSLYVRLLQHVGIKQKRVMGSIRHEALVLWHTIALPQHQYHVPHEVRSWFHEEGFSDIADTTIPSLAHMGFGLVGVRQSTIAVHHNAVVTTRHSIGALHVPANENEEI